MRPDEQIVFRDYPLAIWFTAALVLTVAVADFASNSGWEAVVVALVGMAFVAYASTLTVTVDRGRETLTLRYWSLRRTSTKAFRFGEISSVDVVEDDEGERMYRLELVLRSGETVPLRTLYAVGKRRKERRAKRIRTAIGK